MRFLAGKAQVRRTIMLRRRKNRKMRTIKLIR
jgi:hypothetical protein